MMKNVGENRVEHVNHPPHYGGAHNPHEPIKVIRHYKLNFNLGCAIKYVLRAGLKGSKILDLQKAAWYIQDEIAELEARAAPVPESKARPALRPELFAERLQTSEAFDAWFDELIKTYKEGTLDTPCQECIKPVEEAGDVLCDACFSKRYGRNKVR